jgi:predicted methyltransferase
MTPSRLRLVGAALIGLSLAAVGAAARADTPPAVAAALADPARPADQTARDAARKPAEIVAFAGMKSADRVIDFIPGGGYFTMIFSGVVGPQGRVFAVVPALVEARAAPETAKITTFAATHPNISVVVSKGFDLTVPGGPVDVVFTAQNYHDLYNIPSPDPAATLLTFNKAVFAALKPGGIYVVEDHAAPAGSGFSDTKTLHRIDPAVVIKDVEAAGFVLDGQSGVLSNPQDPRTKIVFDPSIRGHTDQFLFRFRKPAA